MSNVRHSLPPVVGLLFAVVLLLLSTPSLPAQSQRVLLLHSFGRDFAPFAAVVESLRSVLSFSHTMVSHAFSTA